MTMTRYMFPDRVAAAYRLAVYTELLAQPDPPWLPPRRRRQVYTYPIFGDWQKADYACAWTQHLLEAARGEVG